MCALRVPPEYPSHSSSELLPPPRVNGRLRMRDNSPAIGLERGVCIRIRPLDGEVRGSMARPLQHCEVLFWKH